MADSAKTLGIATTDPDPWGRRIDRGLELAEKLVPRRSESGGGGSRTDAVITAAIISLLFWGAHEVLGDRAASERDRALTDRVESVEKTLNKRIESMEKVQTDIRIELAGIARAVGADTKK